MSVSELQNDIIKQLLSIRDLDTLKLFKELLSQKIEKKEYKLSNFERRILDESKADYTAGNIVSNDSIFERNKKWLEE